MRVITIGFLRADSESKVPKLFKIKAAVLEKSGEPLVIRELDIPKLLRGQVLVKVFFSGVCRSQAFEIQGQRGVDRWLPHLLGHEGSGVVVDVGPEVEKVKVGDEVILSWIKGVGIEASGAKYVYDKQVINSGPVTTFSNYTVVSENRLVKKPAGLAFDVAALFGCALPTGAGMVLNELNLSPSSKIAVIGLGGIGLSALMMLKALNVDGVIAIDISDEKLELAKKLGATYVINPSSKSVEAEIIKLTNNGLDICIESAGSVASIELGFQLIRKNGGQLIFASHPPEGDKISLSPHDLISGKRISGSWGGATKLDVDIPRMHQLFLDAKIPIDALLTKRYSLEQINLAFEDLGSGSVLRPLLVMSHPEL